MLFEHMPYTNFHDINLEWLLRAIKDLQNEFKTALANFDNRLTAAEAKLTKEIADRKAADAALQTQITNNYNALGTKIINLTNKHNEDVFKLRGEIAASYIDSTEYTDAEIAKIVAMIKALPSNPVFNYFHQKMCTIQHTLQNYYLWLRDHAYSAGWFDSQGMTCRQLDDLGKTTLEWDLDGIKIIKDYQQTWPYQMFDPYNGRKITVVQAVQNLYQLHYTGLKCGEWDSMTYTVGKFDAAGYTAYQIDWTEEPANLDKGDVTK